MATSAIYLAGVQWNPGSPIQYGRIINGSIIKMPSLPGVYPDGDCHPSTALRITQVEIQPERQSVNQTISNGNKAKNAQVKTLVEPNNGTVNNSVSNSVSSAENVPTTETLTNIIQQSQQLINRSRVSDSVSRNKVVAQGTSSRQTTTTSQRAIDRVEQSRNQRTESVTQSQTVNDVVIPRQLLPDITRARQGSIPRQPTGSPLRDSVPNRSRIPDEVPTRVSPHAPNVPRETIENVARKSPFPRFNANELEAARQAERVRQTLEQVKAANNARNVGRQVQRQGLGLLENPGLKKFGKWIPFLNAALETQDWIDWLRGDGLGDATLPPELRKGSDAYKKRKQQREEQRRKSPPLDKVIVDPRGRLMDVYAKSPNNGYDVRFLGRVRWFMLYDEKDFTIGNVHVQYFASTDLENQVGWQYQAPSGEISEWGVTAVFDRLSFRVEPVENDTKIIVTPGDFDVPDYVPFIWEPDNEPWEYLPLAGTRQDGWRPKGSGLGFTPGTPPGGLPAGFVPPKFSPDLPRQPGIQPPPLNGKVNYYDDLSESDCNNPRCCMVCRYDPSTILSAIRQVMSEQAGLTRVIAPSEFPSVLPLLTSGKPQTIANYPELFIYLLKNLDSINGQFPLKVTRINADGKESTVELESVSHALQELFALGTVIGEDAQAALILGGKSNVETIQNRVQTAQMADMVQALLKWTDIAVQPKARTLKIGLTPSATGLDGQLQNNELEAFLKPSEQNYVGTELVEKDGLMSIVRRILSSTEIVRQVFWRKLKPGKDQIIEGANTGKRKPTKLDEKRWESFIKELESAGYTVDKTPKKPQSR